MHVIYLAGGIASGKSTVAATMKECGATLIDLDELSRQALSPWSPIIPDIVREFGDDIITPTGAVKRRLLAERAFSSTERAVTLEEIELPVIDELLRANIAKIAEEEAAERAENPDAPERVVVVEVPLLDRMRGSFDMADEIVGVVCPLPARRARALQKGFDRNDFERRVAQQPSDRYVIAHSNHVFNNIRTIHVFAQQVRDWWHEREEQGWENVPKRGAGVAKA